MIHPFSLFFIRISLPGYGNKVLHLFYCNSPDDILRLPKTSLPDEEWYSLRVPWSGVIRLLSRQFPFVLHSDRKSHFGIEGRYPVLRRRFVQGHGFQRILCIDLLN